MSYEIKFGYITGYNLVFAAYQPDGSGRGIEQQPLIELREGYYAATPVTDLEAGDEIIACVLEDLYWEDERLYYLTEEYLYWEGDRLYWEDEWLVDYDDLINEPLTSVGAVVGANEYTIDAGYFDSIQDDIDDIITEARTVNNVYDETGMSTEDLQRLINAEAVGYVKRRMV